jgi:hypothetical protein
MSVPAAAAAVPGAPAPAPLVHQAAGSPAAKVVKGPSPAPPPTHQGQEFSATNGTWTIGGMSKEDVYKLVVNNGLA